METKATRLEKLSTCVRVPAFVRVRRGIFQIDQVPQWNQYIVRGVSGAEDQERSSHAGQFITLGPIARGGVVGAVREILRHPAAIEVIVQEYRPGVNGVAFCFAADFFSVEYSAYPEGVTAGKVRPFVAVLPTQPGSRYERLQADLLKIYTQFGPSDVEFVGIEDPVFVQVRPITSAFTVDRAMVALQMNLQDSISGKWIENDLAHVIGEHGRYDAVFVSLYARSLAAVLQRYFKRSVDISARDVIHVGSQYFVSGRFVESTALNWFDVLRFAFIFHRVQGRLQDAGEKDVSLEELFERSILSSMAYTLLKKRAFFDIRERYRQVIDARLKTLDPAGDNLRRFSYDGKLDSIIELDSGAAVWKAIRNRDSYGIQIVPGRFDREKYFAYREGRAIPNGAIVLCDYLYPDIGRSIDTIRGVLCANGSANSHVAILCRERNIPLVIQADMKHYR